MTPEQPVNKLTVWPLALLVWLAAVVAFTALSGLYLPFHGAAIAYQAFGWGLFLALPAYFFSYFLLASRRKPSSPFCCLLPYAAILMLLLIGSIGIIGLRLIATYAWGTCRQNTAQLALSLTMYADDHQGLLPPAGSWETALLPYARNTLVYFCPADSTRGQNSYALNRNLAGIDLRKLKHPERVVTLYESDHPEIKPPRPLALAFRHRGAINLAFADGHASTYNPTTNTPRLEWDIASGKE